MRVAVTGGSGMIGSALIRALMARGDDAVSLRRGRPDSASADWDPTSAWVREGALDGFDAVVHLAGANIGGARWSKSRKRLLRDSRIAATRTLLGGLGGLPPERRPRVLVAASAVGYYGDRGDDVLTEVAPRGEGFLAELVEAWEAETAKAADLRLRVVQTRSGVVLARQGGALKKMLLPFQLGVGGRLGSGRQWMAWVSLDDEVRAILHAIDSDLEGPVNVGHAVRNADFTKALGGALRRPTLIPIPKIALEALYGQMGEETLFYSQRIDPAKLEASGFNFRHPDIDSGLESALRGGD